MLTTNLESFLTDKIKELAFVNVGRGDALVSSNLLDSITVVDLGVAIEDEYGIKIPFTEITEENFDSVERIMAYLQSKGLNPG